MTNTPLSARDRRSIKVQQARLTRLLRFLQNKQGKILDIGCQSGKMCSQFAKIGLQPFGIDIESDLVESAKKKFPELSFTCADCEREIPFSDKYFDFVWAGDVIEHIRATDHFLNEINRVLKIGGIFALSTPEHNVVKSVMIALATFDRHFNPEFPHLRFYTQTSLREVTQRRGFSVSSVHHFGRIRPFSNTMLFFLTKESDQKVISPVHH